VDRGGEGRTGPDVGISLVDELVDGFRSSRGLTISLCRGKMALGDIQSCFPRESSLPFPCPSLA
jgi:hypothetical protein